MNRTNRLGTCPENAIIGAAIRTHREAARLTQADLAARLNCASQLISDYEAGKTAVKGPVLVTMARLLNVPVGTLLPDTAGVPAVPCPPKARDMHDLTGQTFGWLTVIGPAAVRKDSRQRTWACVCQCGNVVDVLAGNLRYGHTKSCGCWAKTARLKGLERRAAGKRRRPAAGIDPDWDGL